MALWFWVGLGFVFCVPVFGLALWCGLWVLLCLRGEGVCPGVLLLCGCYNIGFWFSSGFWFRGFRVVLGVWVLFSVFLFSC